MRESETEALVITADWLGETKAGCVGRNESEGTHRSLLLACTPCGGELEKYKETVSRCFSELERTLSFFFTFHHLGDADLLLPATTE